MSRAKLPPQQAADKRRPLSRAEQPKVCRQRLTWLRLMRWPQAVQYRLGGSKVSRATPHALHTLSSAKSNMVDRPCAGVVAPSCQGATQQMVRATYML